jgi:hypothetical protein
LDEAIRLVEASGKVQELFVTVHCLVISKREANERVNYDGGSGGAKRDNIIGSN